MGTEEDQIRIARAEAARTSVDLIKKKLHRTIRHLAESRMNRITGRVDEFTQHAIRILESRQRLAERMWQANYGTKRDLHVAQCEILLNRDHGDMLFIGERNHGVGRLDCRACDFEYDDSDGFPVNRSLGRVCKACEKGVQHAGTVVTSTQGEQNDPGGSQGPTNQLKSYHPVWVCDFCGVQLPRTR